MNRWKIITDKASSLDTATLISSLVILDRPNLDESERIVRACLCDVLEERYPAAVVFMEAWVEDEWAAGQSYAQALVMAIAELQVSA